MIYEEFKKSIQNYAKKLQDDDTSQELTLFLIELLYDIDLSCFTKENDGLKRYILVSLKNKYYALLQQKIKFKKQLDNLKPCENDYIDITSNITLREALECLSERQRLIIVYKYIYCLSDCEIARILDISRQAVNRLKNRSFSVLKNFYAE